jgi:hypothetical protein
MDRVGATRRHRRLHASVVFLLAAFEFAGGCGGSIDPSTSASDGGTQGLPGDGSALHDGTTMRDGSMDAGRDGTVSNDSGLGQGDGDATSFQDTAQEDADGGVDVGPDDGVDSAIPCNSGTCPSPSDVTGFQPMWIPPSGAHQGVCTAALIADFYSECLDLNGGQGCADFSPGDAAHQACASCLRSDYGAAVYGPLIYEPDGIVETNTAGCLALLQPSAQPCALALEAIDECEHAACDPVCNVSTDSNFDQWVACSSLANTCACSTYFAQSKCTEGVADDGGAGAQCLVGKTFENYYFTYAALFCGN